MKRMPRGSALPPKGQKFVRRWMGGLGAALFWLGLWAAAAVGVGQPLLLPDPVSVLETLARLVGAAAFWQAVGGSMLRAVAAFGLGVALGAALAAAAAAFPLLRILLRPALAAVRATPVSSFIILALVWLKAGMVPVLTGTLMVLPIVWGNVSQGIAKTDPKLLEMARAYGFSRARTLGKVYVLSVLPFFLSACATGMGLCWKATIAAEVLGRPKGAIGAYLYDAKIFLETDALFAWTLAVILLSLALERAFAWAVRKATARGPAEGGDAGALRA